MRGVTLTGGRRMVLLAAMVVSSIVVGCSSSDDAAAPATTEAPTDAPAAGGDTGDADETEADAPATRHVVVVGVDGLVPEVIDRPESDLLVRLRERGNISAGAAVPDADGSCAAAWSTMMRPGADGEHLLDVVAGTLDGAAIGAFAANPTIGESITPSNSDAVTEIADVDIPGLQPWPKALLGVEQIRDASITEIAGVEAPSVFIVQADLLGAAGADPALAGNAADGVDDLIDFLMQAIDARRHRADEDWMVVVSGVCAAGGAPTTIVYGDGVEPGDRTIADNELGGLIAAYLGIDAKGWAPAPEGILADVDVVDGRAK